MEFGTDMTTFVFKQLKEYLSARTAIVHLANAMIFKKYFQPAMTEKIVFKMTTSVLVFALVMLKEYLSARTATVHLANAMIFKKYFLPAMTETFGMFHLQGQFLMRRQLIMRWTLWSKRVADFKYFFFVADNKVTKNFFNTSDGELSTEGAKTIESIVNASSYALSIVLVGTDDGCWEYMKKFQEMIPKRKYDNFQFVNFTEIMPKDGTLSDKEAAFAQLHSRNSQPSIKQLLNLVLLGVWQERERKSFQALHQFLTLAVPMPCQALRHP
ncbi:hypothetical protein CerSpe_148770 [Prunus speciosa]